MQRHLDVLSNIFKAGAISVPAGRSSTDSFPQIEELHWNCPWKMFMCPVWMHPNPEF